MCALAVEKGVFTKTTSTSTPVSQTVTLANASLTPKIIICWTTGQTTINGTYSEVPTFSYGFSDGVNDASQGYKIHETTETEQYVFHNDSIISLFDPSGTGNSEVSVANINAVAAGSFTLQWTTQSNTAALHIHYMVIGGTDITNAQVVSTTTTNTTTGNHSWNGTGTAFTPKFALTMTGADGYTTTNTRTTGSNHATVSIGACDGTHQWVCAGKDKSVATSDNIMYYDSANCLANFDPTTPSTLDYLASFVSFDNAAGGGITLNVTNAASSSTQRLAFLFIDGTCAFEAGSFQQRSGTGTQDVTFSDTGLDPSLVFLTGINSTNLASVANNIYLGFGGSDGTNEGASFIGNTDNLGTYVSSKADLNTKVYRIATPAATASSSTTNAECDMNDMSTAGKFTLDWTTADTTLRRMGYWTVGTGVAGTQFNRSPDAENVTVADSSLTRLLSAVRAPTADTITVADSSLTRMLSATRVPSTDSTVVTDSSTNQSITRVRLPSTDSITSTDESVTRIVSAVRLPSTETPAVSENVSRMLSATRIPSSDTVTAVDSSTTKSATRVRAPTTDTVTPSDSSLTRMLSAVRIPSADTVTVTAGTSTRMLSATRIPSADTITTSENLSGGKVIGRIPATETVTVVDSSLTRILSSTRVPSADSITVLDSSLTRMLSLLRIPSQDSITTSENLTSQYTQGTQAIQRTPAAENVTIADSSLTRLLSALRLPSTDSITLGEQLTRILSAIRSPSSDIITTADNATRIRSLSRATAADSITVLDSSVTRMLSALRLPSQDTITVTAGTATRMKSALRLPSTEIVSISESLGSTVSGRISRSVSDTVNIVESSLNRMLQSFRVVPTDTTNVNEQLTRSRTAVRLTTADTSVVSEAALTRVVSLTRSVTSDTTAIIESALNRMLSAVRNQEDTISVSELVGIVGFTRALEDTISISEPVLNRIVTAIRTVAPESVNISESVFFQTFHKFVFDSVTVAESLFKERTQLSGSVTYATPDEVRPLLGNIGPTQRTDDQINLAIDAAYDEINTKTNRIPPNEWKDTDHNFGVIKKLTRYIAAKEMAVGIKDFDTEALQAEIDRLWEILTYDTTSSATQNIVVSSQPETYASLREGIIWSTRYNNLKKNASNENDTTINPDT